MLTFYFEILPSFNVVRIYMTIFHMSNTYMEPGESGS
jgi:hypothetical protein